VTINWSNIENNTQQNIVINVTIIDGKPPRLYAIINGRAYTVITKYHLAGFCKTNDSMIVVSNVMIPAYKIASKL
jgi:hypothetical protein